MKKNKSKKKLILILLTLGILLLGIMGAIAMLMKRNYETPYYSMQKRTELTKKLKAHVATSSLVEQQLPYRLFIPDDYNKNKSYPLILWLHGSGGRGTDNTSQMGYAVDKLISKEVQEGRPSFVMVPQCPKGHQWVEIDDSKGGPLLNYEVERLPQSVWFTLILEELKNLEQQYTIDSNRIYVAGFSMGASGTWDIIVRNPNIFAAAITMSGRNDPTMAHNIAHLPLWSFHGIFDRVAPIFNTLKMKKAIEKNGGKIKMTPLLYGHSITRYAFSKYDVFNWLFEQQKSVKCLLKCSKSIK